MHFFLFFTATYIGCVVYCYIYWMCCLQLHILDVLFTATYIGCVVYSYIYWMEKLVTGNRQLMRCKMDGSRIGIVLGMKGRWRRSDICNCSITSLSAYFALDQSTQNSLRIYIYDDTRQMFWLTDEKGCLCHRIAYVGQLASNGKHVVLP